MDIAGRQQTVHEVLRKNNANCRWRTLRTLISHVADFVWMQNKRNHQGLSVKLQPKHLRPYKIIRAFKNHTYEVKHGQQSVQSEARLKLHRPAMADLGRAPISQEPAGQPQIMRKNSSNPGYSSATSRQWKKDNQQYCYIRQMYPRKNFTM